MSNMELYLRHSSQMSYLINIVIEQLRYKTISSEMNGAS